MKLVKQSVELHGIYDWEAIRNHIVRAGETCYKSQHETPEEISKFIKKIVKMGHLSVLEHASVSFRIITSRAVLAQITRHRFLSFSVESQRYCKYAEDVVFIEPEGKSPFFMELWTEAMLAAELSYHELLTISSPQDARLVLPNSTKCEFVVSANLRAWYEYLKLRTGGGVQEEHKELAKSILVILNNYLPEVYENLIK